MDVGGSPKTLLSRPSKYIQMGVRGVGDKVLLGGGADGTFVRTDDAAKVEVKEAIRLVRLCDGE